MAGESGNCCLLLTPRYVICFNGIVIASADAVAADVVGARLLGFNAQAVRYLWEAGRLGLGETDTGQMSFPALSLKEAIRAFTKAAYGKELTFQHA